MAKGKLRLAHVHAYDQSHRNSAYVRSLEMDVDSVCQNVGHPAYCVQFFQDCSIYGLREAYTYLHTFAFSKTRRSEEVEIAAKLSAVKAKIDEIEGKFDLNRIS